MVEYLLCALIITTYLGFRGMLYYWMNQKEQERQIALWEFSKVQDMKEVLYAMSMTATYPISGKLQLIQNQISRENL